MSGGDLAWLLLAIAGLAGELASPPNAFLALVGRVGASTVGRLVLVAAWGYLGWHLFARHGVALVLAR